MGDAATSLPGEAEQKVSRRHYSAVFVLTMLLLVIADGISLRGACSACKRCYFWLMRKIPSHTTIRNWIMQVGYYKLTTIQKSKEWIGMIDLSVQVGSKKCLLILGVQASVLLRGKPLTFEDVQVLHMELLEQTSGSIICEALKKSEKVAGQYVQLCHDQGSDIVAGTKLYTQHIQATEGRKISIINDIAHKIANLLASEAAELGWEQFASKAAHMKKKWQLTKWAALCPPQQRSKARYMNLDELVAWVKQILTYLQKEENAHLEKITKQLPGWENSIAHLNELVDQLGWVRSYEVMINEISNLLLVGKIVRQKIRLEGVHKKTTEELESTLKTLGIGERADQFTGSILDFINAQTKDLEGVALGSTEIIESAFGKLKHLMDENTKEGFTPFVLSLAACLGKLDLDTVKAALRTCGKKQVQDWAIANVGETIYSQRRRLFNPFKKRKKLQEVLSKDSGDQDLAGIFSEQVVNF